MSTARTVAIVGAGGNIGSHLVPLVARLPELERLVLVDPERYEATNLEGQAIALRDVGHAKARVQAARVRRIRRDLEVDAIVGAVEQVPLGRLRADWIVACLDSRRARQTVGEMARRLGVPWIDTGVAAGDRLARVTVFGAGAESACLECGWDERDYAALEQSYPCSAVAAVAPTAAPAALGALAASLAALACERDPARACGLSAAEQIVVAAASGRLVRSRLSRRAACRVADHAPSPIGRVALDPAHTTLGELLAVGAERLEAPEACMAIAGRRFARRWRCPRCGRARRGLRLAPVLDPRRCGVCREPLVANGFESGETVSLGELSRSEGGLRLATLGVRRGDVAGFVAAGRHLRLEIGSDRR